MTLGWSSCAKIASSVVECWKAYFRGYTWKIYIKDLSNFIAVNNSIFTFSQYSMVSISKLLIGEERRYSTPESSILLGTVVLKIFCNRFFAQWYHMVSQTPVFFPIFFAKYLEFVSSHIPAIKRLAQFGVHVRHWLSLDKLRLDRCVTIYDVTDERTCIPSHIISIVEDVHDMKRCTLQIKKEIGVIKRFITPIYNFLWLYWWGETASSTPYCVEIRMFRVKWLNTIADGDLVHCVAMSSASTVL